MSKAMTVPPSDGGVPRRLVHSVGVSLRRRGSLWARYILTLGAGLLASSLAPADDAPFAGLVRFGEAHGPQFGAFSRVPEDIDPERTILGGARFTDSFHFVRAVNAAGRAYVLALHHNRDGKDTFAVFSNEGPSTGVGFLKLDPRTPKPPGHIDVTYDSQTGARHSDALTGLEIKMTARDIVWKQAGAIDLAGKVVTPGWYLYLPWRNGSDSGVEGFASQQYPVTGTIFGEPVSGILDLETHHDRVNYADGLAPRKYSDHGYWSLWMTQYDDGTTESGTFVCGEDGSRTAFATDNRGRVLFDTTRLNIKIELGENDLLKSSEYSVEGRPWEVIPAPASQLDVRGMLPPGAPRKIALVGGVTRRKGEQRKVLNSLTEVEGNPQFRCAPMH